MDLSEWEAQARANNPAFNYERERATSTQLDLETCVAGSIEEDNRRLRAALVAAIEESGHQVSGPADWRAAEDNEPKWVCRARAALAGMDW